MNFDPRSPRCEGDHGEVSRLGECHTVSTAGVIEPHPATPATCIYTLCPPRQSSLLLRDARLHRMVTDAIRTPRRYGEPGPIAPSLHRSISPRSASLASPIHLPPPPFHPTHYTQATEARPIGVEMNFSRRLSCTAVSMTFDRSLRHGTRSTGLGATIPMPKPRDRQGRQI